MSEITTLRAAAKVAGVSAVTILDWCDRLAIGEKRDGRWRINRDRLMAVVRAKAVLRGS